MPVASAHHLGGSSVRINNLGPAVDFSFDQVINPDVVAGDLRDSDEADRGATFAWLKAKLCACQLSGRKRRVPRVVDEATAGQR